MVKYAPVGPIRILQDLDNHNLLGNYCLVLAHDVLAHMGAYHDMFHKDGERGRDRFVILDNSAVELGIPIIHNLLHAASHISADAICLPDVIGDREGTVKAVEELLKSFTGLQIMTHNWMAIPQGETEDDILRCARDLCNLLGKAPDYWGVPRWIANKFGTRKNIVDNLSAPNYQNISLWDMGKRRNVHLLGMSVHLADDLACCKMPRVMGIDSANPIVLGLKHRNIMTQYAHEPRLETIDHGMPHGEEVVFNYWEEEEINEYVIANIIKLRSVL